MSYNLPKHVKYIIASIICVACINIVVFIQLFRSPATTSFQPVLDYPDGNLFEHKKKALQTGKSTHTVKSTGSCPELKKREPLQEGQFQVINGYQAYVYSAFHDKDVVRIIAVSQRVTQNIDLICQLWYRMDGWDHLMIVNTRVENLPEDHERRFTAAYILCQLPREPQYRGHIPNTVSIVTGNPCSESTNILYVHAPGKMESKFTVCVTPLNFRYSRAHELVEMVEMNKLLGADNIIFYNYSIGPNVDKVLEMYAKEGDVEIHPWQLPMKTDTWPPSGKPEIHYFAQMASLNDCLFRYRNRSQYLVYQDLDEFIIPRKHDTWAELIQEREKLLGEISSFQFRCVFFRKEWPSPAKDFQNAAKKFKSIILTHTLKESKYYIQGLRSKFIINPRLTTSVGVHQVWEASHRMDLVPETVASLHHYRTWELPNDPQTRVADVLVVEKFGSRLVDRLEKVWLKLVGVPMDIDISSYGDHV